MLTLELSMKCIIQIPCLNEEGTLEEALNSLPRVIPGIDEVGILIVDDGSTDRTVEIAKNCGVSRIISFGANRGLARAFSTGLETSLQMGADVIVHTDADNQYRAAYIGALIQPILRREADIVVGCRPIEDIEDFSWIKKRLQRLGSWVVRKISGTNVEDATSGFRAYSREAALRLSVVSRFTYTLETLIQAGQRGIRVATVPVEVNRTSRKSRLSRSTFDYVKRSLGTIILVSTQFRPLRTFIPVGVFSIVIGLIPSIRFIFLYFFSHEYGGHLQSLLLSAILFVFGSTSILIGLLAEQVASNRRILEDIMASLRESKYGLTPVKKE